MTISLEIMVPHMNAGRSRNSIGEMRIFHHSIPAPQLFFVKAVCRWRWQIRIHFTDRHLLDPSLGSRSITPAFCLHSSTPAMPRSQNFMQIPPEARPLCLCNWFVVMISIVICDWICFIGCHARVKEVMPLFTKGTVFSMQFPCVEASPYPTTRCTSTTTLVHIYVLKGLRQLWSCPRLPVNEKLLWSFAINFEMIMN